MGDVVSLIPEEPVQLDHDQLAVLVSQMGAAGADHLVSHAMEELGVLLARLANARPDMPAREMLASIRALVAIAQQIGMTQLARVGRDLLLLASGHDSLAFCAVLARLGRIGNASLLAVWDLRDMRI